MVPETTWGEVNSKLHHLCPEVTCLIDLILSLPCSSSNAERGFSKMKMVKTDWRSKLKDRQLSDLLTVALETPGLLHVILKVERKVITK